MSDVTPGPGSEDFTRVCYRGDISLWSLAPEPTASVDEAEQEITQLRTALGQIQADLIQCQRHRSLCVHEQDALKIANEALLAH